MRAAREPNAYRSDALAEVPTGDDLMMENPWSRPTRGDEPDAVMNDAANVCLGFLEQTRRDPSQR